MPDGRPGRTNGVDMIWMDKHLQQVERRCTLTHELVHIENGDTNCNCPLAERRARAETARRLIPIEDLIRHIAWARSIHELADELWVTETVLMDRLEGLSPEEQALVDQVEKQ